MRGVGFSLLLQVREVDFSLHLHGSDAVVLTSLEAALDVKSYWIALEQVLVNFHDVAAIFLLLRFRLYCGGWDSLHSVVNAFIPLLIL